jgi:hypothetical protein
MDAGEKAACAQHNQLQRALLALYVRTANAGSARGCSFERLGERAAQLEMFS